MTDSVVVVQTPFSKVNSADGSRRMQAEVVYPKNGPTTDGFGRLRVSEPYTIFDAKQLYDDQPLLLSNAVVDTGAVNYVFNRAASELTSGTGATGKATRQTRRYFNYQSGKGQLIFTTYNMYGAEAGCEKRVGYFDDNNGVFIRLEGDGAISIVLRTSTSGSAVDTVIPQSSWSHDRMDGSGPSGNNHSNITLDLSKTQILVIDFEWLGAGTMRVGFDIGGEIVYAHEFEAANVGTVVYMRTPNLPVRWEIENTGTPGSDPKLDAICCSVQSEGGLNPVSLKRSVDRGIDVVSAVGTTLYPLLSIRLKSALVRSTVFPSISGVLATAAGDFRWAVMLFPNGAGLPAGTWNSVTNSAVEYDTARTTITTPSNGVVLKSGYGGGTNQSAPVQYGDELESILALGANIAGTTSDEIVLAVQTLAGTNNFAGGLGWIEWL